MHRRLLTPILLFLVLCSTRCARGYIDMPAERLTLPRLLLEFRTSGVYRIAQFDPERGVVQYELVETLQGNPPQRQRHLLRIHGKIPAELPAIEAGQQAVVLGADPYGRTLTFLNGAWYIVNFDRDVGALRLEYTSAYFDFRCAFSGELPLLIDASKMLLDGQEVIVPCHKKPKSSEVAQYAVSLRDPHRRLEIADVATRPSAATTHPAAAGGHSPENEPPAKLLATLKEGTTPDDRLHAARTLSAT